MAASGLQSHCLTCWEGAEVAMVTVIFGKQQFPPVGEVKIHEQ